MATGDRDFGERYARLTKLAGDAADAVDDQIKQLRKAPEAGKDATVQKEAAILAALVARQSTADQHLETRSVLDRRFLYESLAVQRVTDRLMLRVQV
jgi:hypothetical protein